LLCGGTTERLFERYPDVDVAFGPGTISHLGDWLGAGGEGVARGSFGTGEERAFAARLPVRRERRFQAWVQVSMGCNSSAPTASSRPSAGARRRGARARCCGGRAARRRRRPRGDAARPERQLYGRDVGSSFAELLRAVDAVPGIERIASRVPTRRTSGAT
jgi:tRNA-2-methylthio-N6-dimethylallyladenosine synthase